MLTKIALGVLAVPVAAVALVGATGVAVVDVREAKGTHIVVPVPLIAVRAAAAFVPTSHLRIPEQQAAEALRHLPLAREVITALAAAPDCELVRVEERDERVVISKRGDLLHIQVEGHDQVDVQVPLSAVLAFLPDEHGRVHLQSGLAALGSSRMTQFVNVKSQNGDEVKISLW